MVTTTKSTTLTVEGVSLGGSAGGCAPLEEVGTLDLVDGTGLGGTDGGGVVRSYS